MQSFESLLEEAIAKHGHLCAGLVIGVRMSMLGCRLIGIEDPLADEWRKKIIVFIEIDGCAVDAVQSVTGCSMGRRTLKFRDFGINAGTFVNLETGKAYRIVSTEESRQLADLYAPEEADRARRQLIGYQKMPDSDLFNVQAARVRLEDWELPGPARRKVTCAECGQVVRDGREIKVGDSILCMLCGGMAYFEPCVPCDS